MALKRLSASDLTFFESHFRHTTGAKQKAINIDSRVFIESMYPSVPTLAKNGRIAIDLYVYGPGGGGLHNIQRKIIKQQKNWRLDGELVPDPEGEAERYSALRKGDFALIEFIGEVKPDSARVHLVAEADPVDAEVHGALGRAFLGRFSSQRGMIELSLEEIDGVLRPLGLEDHPVSDFLDIDDLEHAARGGIEGAKRLRGRRRRRGRTVSPEEMQQARADAESVGRVGEELLNQHLARLEEEGNISGYRWEAALDAVSPYDFSVRGEGGALHHVEDAKSTRGDFGNPIHISYAELEEMALGEVPYWLVRLYEVTEEGAKFRIAKDTQEFAREVLKGIGCLPSEVQVDSVSVKPSALVFGYEMSIDARVGMGMEGEQMDLL